MSGHNLVAQLAEAAVGIGDGYLKAPLFAFGAGAPSNSGADRDDAHIYINTTATSISAAIYVNLINGSTSGPGHATLSNWDALTG